MGFINRIDNIFSKSQKTLKRCFKFVNKLTKICNIFSRPSLSHMSNRKDLFQREEAQWGQERESEVGHFNQDPLIKTLESDLAHVLRPQYLI